MDQKRKDAIFKAISNFFQSLMTDALAEWLAKKALKTLLKSATATGARASIITFLVKEGFQEFGEPTIKAAFVELGYAYDRINGKILVRRLEDARENGNAEDYDRAADDIMS